MNLTYNKNDIFLPFTAMKLLFNEQKQLYHLIGHSKNKNQFGILTIQQITLNSGEDIKKFKLNQLLIQSSTHLDKEQMDEFHLNNQQLKFVTKSYGIVGFIKFLLGYYMLLITQKRMISKIGSYKIYKVKNVEYIPLYKKGTSIAQNQRLIQLEEKYFKSLSYFNIQDGLYYSPSYDLTNSLQANLAKRIFPKKKQTNLKEQQQKYQIDYSFMWNYYLLIEFIEILGPNSNIWSQVQIYGYIEQERFFYLAKQYSLTLISRRSRFHAGTRYNKRGLNSDGNVANFVETEQILVDITARQLYQFPKCTSFIQIRGSIPIFWYQKFETLIKKPDVMIPNNDLFYIATRKHICDMIKRYGPSIQLINLVKKGSKFKNENNLEEEYKKAINFLNENIKELTYNNIQLNYIHFDMKNAMKQDKISFYERAIQLGLQSILQNSIFSVVTDTKNNIQVIELQKGIMRSNCVDCLDRTNFFQQIISTIALSFQLAKINNKKFSQFLDINDNVLKQLRGMFLRTGDVLSLQYGGSLAHRAKDNIINEIDQKQKIENKKVNIEQLEVLTSIKRHYNNIFTDNDKQQTIDLFLGNFIPQDSDQVHIWELKNIILHYPNLNKKYYLESHQWVKDSLNAFNKKIQIFEEFNKINYQLKELASYQILIYVSKNFLSKQSKQLLKLASEQQIQIKNQTKLKSFHSMSINQKKNNHKLEHNENNQTVQLSKNKNIKKFLHQIKQKYIIQLNEFIQAGGRQNKQQKKLTSLTKFFKKQYNIIDFPKYMENLTFLSKQELEDEDIKIDQDNHEQIQDPEELFFSIDQEELKLFDRYSNLNNIYDPYDIQQNFQSEFNYDKKLDLEEIQIINSYLDMKWYFENDGSNTIYDNIIQHFSTFEQMPQSQSKINIVQSTLEKKEEKLISSNNVELIDNQKIQFKQDQVINVIEHSIKKSIPSNQKHIIKRI